VDGAEDGVQVGDWHGIANVSTVDRCKLFVRHHSRFVEQTLTLQSFYYGTVVFAGTGIKNSFVTQMILVSKLPLRRPSVTVLTSLRMASILA
jgi:hypothetical protein